MSTHELQLFLATNKKRVSGRMTIGISRLPVGQMLQMLASGYTLKYLRKSWPQVDYEQWLAINRLYKDLKLYGFVLTPSSN